MLPDLLACRSVARVSAAEARLLSSPQRPIVLLTKLSRASLPDVLADNIAPGQSLLGVMLPYSALHALLLEMHRPLVMTSGNVSDEPIVWENEQAVDRLASIADAFLLHNRPIHSMCDDSVARAVDGTIYPLRRSRGFAPLPVRLVDHDRFPAANVPAILAVGGEIKTTFCVANSRYAYLSQHIGNLENFESLEALQRNVGHYLQMLQIKPAGIVCDLHPDYLSTAWAREFALKCSVPLLQVQHHHAHLAALACEHRLGCEEALLGMCFDGTGYGLDGTIWGGEVLLLSGAECERLAHLQTRPLPGGEASIRKPYRTALAYLAAAGIDWEDDLPCVQACSAHERRVLRQQIERGINCPLSSSMGRCFDAVASLIGVRQQVNFEAQAAMEMETLAADFFERHPFASLHAGRSAKSTTRAFDSAEYRFEFDAEPGGIIDFDNLLRAVCEDVRAGLPIGVMAAKFHCAVARLVTELAQAYCERLGMQRRLGLSGGVFQNGLLLRLIQSMLAQRGIELLVHREVPTNDGGLALGQAWIARQRF
jgi:hydrogenase maturation protein HypF